MVDLVSRLRVQHLGRRSNSPGHFDLFPEEKLILPSWRFRQVVGDMPLLNPTSNITGIYVAHINSPDLTAMAILAKQTRRPCRIAATAPPRAICGGKHLLGASGRDGKRRDQLQKSSSRVVMEGLFSLQQPPLTHVPKPDITATTPPPHPTSFSTPAAPACHCQPWG